MAKQSELNREYSREIHRLRQAIKRAEKAGLIYTESPLPKKPKVITEASIRKLKRIKPVDIRERGYIVNKDTGELRKYHRPKHPKRSGAKQKNKENIPKRNSRKKRPNDKDEIIKKNLTDQLQSAINDATANYLLSLLDEYGLSGYYEGAEGPISEAAQVVNRSSQVEDLINNADLLARLITGSRYNVEISKEIHRVAFEDRPARRRR